MNFSAKDVGAADPAAAQDRGAARQAAEQKSVNLAPQGGGSHGAFNWGVLDRLLEDKRLSFEGITATSSGAVNAVVLADGLAAGGRQRAQGCVAGVLAEGIRPVVVLF